MKKLLLSIFLSLLICSPALADWDKTLPSGSTLINDLDVGIPANMAALDTGLASFCDIDIAYTSSSTVTASAGSCVVSNSGGTTRVFINNSSSTAVTFADIDTGAEAGSTTYYVYAVAAATSSTTATFKVSTSASAPTGATYFKKLGSFYNNSSSDIESYKVYSNAYKPSSTDSNGIPKVTAIYDFGTSTSSYTLRQSDLKFGFGQQSVGAGSSATISNLPFSSTSTYSCVASSDSGGTSSDESTGQVRCNKSSGSSVILRNTDNITKVVNWIAIGN